MELINPCKKCVVKACCSKKCEKKKNFHKLYDRYGVPIILLLFLFNVIGVILTIIFILKFLNYSLSVRLLILFIIWSAPFTILAFMDKKGFKEDPFEILGFYIILPLIIFTINAVRLIENIIGTNLFKNYERVSYMFQHPCDTCLVQACCDKICDKYKNFVRISNIISLTFLILSIPMSILIIAAIVKISPTSHIAFFLILLVWIICTVGSVIIIKHYESTKIPIGAVIFIGILSPIIFPACLMEALWIQCFGKTNMIHEKRLTKNIK